MRWLQKFEYLLMILGLLMVVVYLGAWSHKTVLSRINIDHFQHAQSDKQEPSAISESLIVSPDFSLWSQKRIDAYEESLAAYFTPAVGILRIARIHVQAPLLEGTDDLTLNRGVGRIQGTAAIGQQGNIGIAGHRDGFFRALKDVQIGDQVELITHERIEMYTVDRMIVVDPSDISILAPRPRPSLTLVTCYPFYFIGSAPKRYIVQASSRDPDGFQKFDLEHRRSLDGSASR